MVFRVVLFALLAGVCSLPVAAGTTHEVRFTQAAKVMVWQDGALIGQGSATTILGDTQTPSNAIVGSGQLVSAAPGLASAAGQIRLSVASNSGFSIHVADQAMAAMTSVRVVSRGANARENVRAPLMKDVVFQQIGKTAQRPGPPQTQALELEISWTGPARPQVWIRAASS